MKKYVIDSCVFARISLEDEYKDSAKARELIKLAILKKVELVAPELLLFELNNILAKYDLTEKQYKKILTENMDLINSGVVRIIATDEKLLSSSWEMSQTDTNNKGYISSYDSTFHTMALQQNAVFLTTDRKHIGKTEKQFGSILHYDDLDILKL